jgi:hypothetical protein
MAKPKKKLELIKNKLQKNYMKQVSWIEKLLLSGFSWDDDVNAKTGKKSTSDNINSPFAGIDTKIKWIW